MAIRSSRVTVDTDPTPLNTADQSGIAGSGMAGKNLSSEQIFLGGDDVTPENGYPVEAGEPFSFDFESAGEIVYATVAAGTAEVALLRVGA